MGEEPDLLDDVADRASQGDGVQSGHVLPADEDLAAVGLEHPVDELQHGGLAAPGLAEQDEDLTVAHGEREVVDRHDVAE